MEFAPLSPQSIPVWQKPAGSCPCNSGSERETQPPEQATEARLVELVPSQPTGPRPIRCIRKSARWIFPQRRNAAQRVAELDRRSLGEFKRVLASAGVDVARLS